MTHTSRTVVARRPRHIQQQQHAEGKSYTHTQWGSLCLPPQLCAACERSERRTARCTARDGPQSGADDAPVKIIATYVTRSVSVCVCTVSSSSSGIEERKKEKERARGREGERNRFGMPRRRRAASGSEDAQATRRLEQRRPGPRRRPHPRPPSLPAHLLPGPLDRLHLRDL